MLPILGQKIWQHSIIVSVSLGWKTEPPPCLNPTVATLRIHMVSVLGQKFGQRRRLQLCLSEHNKPSHSSLVG
jgi:hypothetical protein